ncbi:MAG: phospholipase, partial [Actinomycetota bacterium]|nr:phospholipase [Actinomycetota bacterium]
MSAEAKHGLTRRQVIGAGASAGAALLAGGSVGKALAAQDALTERRLRQSVEHVVVICQENRSFDQYFGTLRGVNGFQDPKALTFPSGRSVFYQPAPNAVGYELPFRLNTRTTSAACVADLSHAWTAQHGAWDGGKMDNWVPAHLIADGSPNGLLTMGYHERADIPWHYALADAFTICDDYHCGVMGPTNPNRLYLWTGMIDPNGRHGGPVVDNSETPPYTWTTYPERLQAAGITWQVYQELDNYDDNPLAWFQQYQQAPKSSPLYARGVAVQASLLDRFAEDVASRRLPQVSWIIGPDYSTEHPPYLPAEGATFMWDLISVLRDNPDVWRKTALFITYDENDGYFDHVLPKAAPTGTPGEYVSPLPAAAGGIAGPIGPGFRVPMIVVSPWSSGGYACGDTFDHTSILRFMERRFGVREPNLSQWRRKINGDLTSAFDFSNPPADFPDLASPDALPTPADPANINQEEAACFVPPGGSGKPPPAPPPAAGQTVPAQEPGTRPRRGRARALSRARLLGGDGSPGV